MGKPWFSGSWHAWVGTAALVSTLAQCIMGVVKARALQTQGVRMFTFHGRLGRVILLSGLASVGMGASSLFRAEEDWAIRAAVWGLVIAVGAAFQFKDAVRSGT